MPIYYFLVLYAVMAALGISSFIIARWIQENAWSEERAFYERLAKNFGGIHPPESFLARFSFGQTTIEFSIYAEGGTRHTALYTRLFANLLDQSLQLEIFTEGIVARVGKFLRLTEDIDTGDERFDRAFVVQSPDDAAADKYLSPKVREAIYQIYEVSGFSDFRMTIEGGKLIVDIRGARFDEELAYRYVELVRQLTDPKKT